MKPTGENEAPSSSEQILNLALGFMASKHLFVATQIGLFEQLGHGPSTLDTLALNLNLPRRTLRIVADAMVALGLVERNDDLYENGDAAQEYLSGRSSEDLRPLLALWNRLSYPGWVRFEQRVRALDIEGHRSRLTRDEKQVFSRGMLALTAAPARELAQIYDFSRHRMILDVAGGSSSFLATIMRTYPGLRATLLDVPPLAREARRRFKAELPECRIEIIEADPFADPPPPGHDAIIVANVMHLVSPERNRELLRSVRATVSVDTRLLLVDVWSDPSRAQSLTAALLAGEFLVSGAEGDVYSEREVRGWLHACGWKPAFRAPLTRAWSLLVAEAV
jgi:hypothetical protein